MGAPRYCGHGLVLLRLTRPTEGTDRCHGAITAAMMGRNVVFYRNSYFKNQAIYDHSLAGMPHVRFIKRTPFSLAQFFRVTYWSRMRPVEMKFRRLFQGRPAVVEG